MKYKLISYLYLLNVTLSQALFAQLPPEPSLKGWEKAGYHKASKEIPSDINYAHIVNVAKPSGNANLDYENIINAIHEAKSYEKSNTKRVLIQLQEGSYQIEKSISLYPEDNFITIRGMGINNTLITHRKLNDRSSIFNLNGRVNSNTKRKVSYDPINKRLDGDFSDLVSKQDMILIDLIVENNDEWYEPFNSTTDRNFLGKILSIKQINSSFLKANEDLTTLWNIIKGTNSDIEVYTFEPIKEIGIENLSIKLEPIDVFSEIYLNNTISETNVFFNYSTDCWAKNIASIGAKNQHIQVSQSTQIEIRDCYFYNSPFHGPEGHGYGVQLQHRSNNCLIENNIFQKLRHSIVLAFSANNNVIGYNYSFQSMESKDYDTSNSTWTDSSPFLDISIHGFFPYSNLIEGNIFNLAKADFYHAKNGYWNTFFRNLAQYDDIFLESTSNTYVIGTLGTVKITSSKGINNVYGYDKDDKIIRNIVLNENITSYYPIASLYHQERPEFIDEKFDWPLIGPPLNINAKSLNNTIPAKERLYNSFTSCSLPILNNYSINSDNIKNSDYLFSNDRYYISGSNFTFDKIISINENKNAYTITGNESIKLTDGFKKTAILNNKEFHFQICSNSISSNNLEARRINNNRTSLKEEFSIYPNPFQSVINLKNTSSIPFQYELINTLGNTISKGSITPHKTLTIDSENITDGLYILRLRQKNVSSQFKLIKK